MIRALTAAALAGATLTAICVTAAEASTPAKKVEVVYDCQHAKAKPARVIVTCGDANEWVNLTYTHYGRRTASGHGVTRANDCTPSCAGGTVKSYPMRFVLSTPKHAKFGKHPLVFTELSITYTTSRTPAGHKHEHDQLLTTRI